MCPKTSRVFRYLVSAFGLGAVIGWSSPSDAYVQQIVIDQTATVSFTPITLGTSTPGSATSYTIYTGRIFGELKPMILTITRSSQISTLRPKIKAGLNTLPILRLSHRPIQQSAAD
jgi:hypothetical protein